MKWLRKLIGIQPIVIVNVDVSGPVIVVADSEHVNVPEVPEKE